MICKRCKAEIVRAPMHDDLVSHSIAHFRTPEAWSDGTGCSCPGSVGYWHEPITPFNEIIADLKNMEADLR